MNKEWSDLNKRFQTLTKNDATFSEGIGVLFSLRDSLFAEFLRLKNALPPEALCEQPFVNAASYHSKTIAYSVYHVFRIEDICAHTLIAADDEIFFRGGFQERVKSPIRTTGNELSGRGIAEFSARLDIATLYEYAAEVKESTESMLQKMRRADFKRKMNAQDRERLLALGMVSEDENAAWLVDYWCGKDVRGLAQMPFSRHWIMHVEAALRIERGVRKPK